MKVMFYTTAKGRSPVEDFIRDLPKADQARFADVYQGIRECGLDCPRVVFRQLRGKLWELKFSGQGGAYRIGYVVVDGSCMIWLHAFKKTSQKTPRDDLKLAEQRMRELI